MHPTEIRLNRNRTDLSVTWDNGATVIYPARLLRLAVDSLAVPPPCNLTITAVEPVGNYAVRVAFSDGHDRGIYPWAYLIEIDGASSKQDSTDH
jgi:DUF971 family protein